MPRSRATEVIDPKNINRYTNYMNQNMSSDDVNRLARAIREDNHGEQRKIIIENSQGQRFIKDLLSVPEYENVLTEELSRVIVTQNSSKITGEDVPYSQGGHFRPTIQQPMVRRPPVTTHKVTQVSRQGTSYTRATPTKWKKGESLFLEKNKNLSNKELISTFNAYYPSRSTSAILTKKYRTEKDGKTKNTKKRHL